MEEKVAETIEQPKMYQIYEILAAAAEWLDDPENQEKADAFEKIKTSLVIREYMPIGQKEICMRKAIIDMRLDEGQMPYTISILYEIAVLFDCLLAYVVNLDADIDGLYKDASFYDIIVLSGLKDYILSFCKKDYREMVHLTDRMISFDNLKELTKAVEFASPESIDSLTKEFKRFTTELNPETIKHLGEIMAGNDPLLTNVKKSIEDSAYNYIQTLGEGSNE